ncbi:D-alanyl-D-alanine carboxypeptidase/D-alanyl-D-alanine-endopeptidase [Maritimibacter sp. UBA3975]|uniref:D-alanyl-D-alanine carboxypeptidase/D-alanyl-D-alanine endopeptidase n=1 Tax=Maritimibacter sp. UBA3975 TaxID=1946833 RepID=UPI0025C3E108|nr:D-alanyl-D-alanine carboxypeptidase/D-alanyl-D-alanine-endopeptidase [Maritimibacter sp. UBA3975]|tara:strand:+ start:4463 stop:5947 length:1485 start_codon:yes stop_codon:yes gene_type:complete
MFLTSAVSALATTAIAEAPLTSIRPMPRDMAGRPPPRRSSVAPDIDSLIAQANLDGQVGFVVADARTGLVLEEREGGRTMPPASVAKSVTALYAFDALGQDHVFETRLVATGGISDGKVQGDLILVGSGDPTLDTNALAGMAQKLAKLGVTGISGAFRVDGSALPYVNSIDPGQPDHLGYNPAVSGLNLNFNRVHFQWTKGSNGYAVEMDARSDRYRPPVRMATMQVVDRDLPVYTYSASEGGVDAWTVAKSALGNGGSRWLPVRRPDLYAGEVFQALARVNGVTLPKPGVQEDAAQGAPIVVHQSESLSDIVRGMLKYSTNITAEALGLAASRARGLDVADLAASGAAMSDWMRERMGADAPAFTDHSGLGDTSRVSPQDLVNMLVRTGPGGALRSHMKTVVAKDEEGQLDPEAGYAIEAKTGTLNFVSTLAGYVTAPDGNVLAFAIFTSDMERRNALTKAERERPPGGRGWAGRSRWLQHQFINRWMTVYGA